MLDHNTVRRRALHDLSSSDDATVPLPLLLDLLDELLLRVSLVCQVARLAVDWRRARVLVVEEANRRLEVAVVAHELGGVMLRTRPVA